MKKYLFLLIAALLIVPGLAFAQSDTLSHDQINQIANSVVMVLSLDKNGQPYASGSGTIIAPTGLIYTNRHVLEGGSDYAILTLTDMGEPAQLTYFATPVMVHQTVDFAVLQIDRDANGKPINSSSLNLPYVTLATTLPEIGDKIYVFGYPSLGDAHLVFTSGEITTIQNDTLNGQRIPYWYQTDAQISPGNSGGLVVNSDGQMIGIPTKVRAEEETLGRLGSILSLSAIRGALQSSQQSGPQPTQAGPVATQPPHNVVPQVTPEVGQQLSIAITSIEHNVTQNNELGMMVHTKASAVGFQNIPLRAAVFLFWADDTPLLANNRAPADERADNGQLTVQQVVTPQYDNTVWDDMWFFVAYTNLPEGQTGTFPAYVEAELGVDGQSFTIFSNHTSFNYTYPTQQLIVDITNIEHNVELNNVNGMKVHTHIRAIGYQGQTVRVGLFVYWKDGTPIPADNAPSENQTSSNYLTVQDTLTPSYDDSEWNDFWFFLPYSYFPTGLHGDQDAYAEIEIGLDGQAFISWSLDENFTLNYPNSTSSIQ